MLGEETDFGTSTPIKSSTASSTRSSQVEETEHETHQYSEGRDLQWVQPWIHCVRYLHSKSL